MTTTTTTKTFDFSTLDSLNENFAAAREAFGWPEPHDGEYLSDYEQRATSMDIDGRPEPDPLLLGLMLYEGVGVSSDETSETGMGQMNDTMSDVLNEIVDEEWQSALEDADADLIYWMPSKAEFMRDHNEFEDEWLQALGMLPDEMRIDPEWDEEEGCWADTCAAWDAAVRDAIDALYIDEFLRKAVRQAIEEAIEEAIAKMCKSEDKEEEEA